MTFTDWVPIIVAALGLLSGGYAIWRQERRDRAEAAERITDAAGRLVDRWEKRVEALETSCSGFKARIAELEDRVLFLEHENALLIEGALRLEGQVITLGHEPCWRVTQLQTFSPPVPGGGG